MKNKKCDKCGAINPLENVFCEECGANFDEKVTQIYRNQTCSKCGKSIAKDLNYCPYCNNIINVEQYQKDKKQKKQIKKYEIMSLIFFFLGIVCYLVPQYIISNYFLGKIIGVILYIPCEMYSTILMRKTENNTNYNDKNNGGLLSLILIIIIITIYIISSF